MLRPTGFWLRLTRKRTGCKRSSSRLGTVQTAELEQYRTTVLSELAERKNSLEAEVARLEQLEEEHRNRMRDYLTQQLAQLEATPG